MIDRRGGESIVSNTVKQGHIVWKLGPRSLTYTDELAYLMVGRNMWHELYGRGTFLWANELNTQSVPAGGDST